MGLKLTCQNGHSVSLRYDHVGDVGKCPRCGGQLAPKTENPDDCLFDPSSYEARRVAAKFKSRQTARRCIAVTVVAIALGAGGFYWWKSGENDRTARFEMQQLRSKIVSDPMFSVYKFDKLTSSDILTLFREDFDFKRQIAYANSVIHLRYLLRKEPDSKLAQQICREIFTKYKVDPLLSSETTLHSRMIDTKDRAMEFDMEMSAGSLQEHFGKDEDIDGFVKRNGSVVRLMINDAVH